MFAHITRTALKEMWVSVWKPIFPILCLCKASKRQGHTFILTEIGSAIIIIIWIYSWVTLPLLNHFLSSSNWPWAHSGKVSECPSCMFVTWFKIESHLAFTCSPSPWLLAAHQYRWFEILCFQFPRTVHDFFLARASIFFDMSGKKKKKNRHKHTGKSLS